MARELGIAEQTLINWRKAAQAGKLSGGSNPVTPERHPRETQAALQATTGVSSTA